MGKAKMFPIPIAVVGVGLVGKRHVNHVLSDPGTTLSAIVKQNPPTELDDFVHELKVPCFTSVDELIAARDEGRIHVAGIIIATPNATHVPLSILLLRSGVNVLVEKPLSVNVEDGRRLVAASKAACTAKLLVGHHRRFNPHIEALKNVLDCGKLGKVLAISGVWTLLKPLDYFGPPAEWRCDKISGGPILINLTHDLDLLQYLCGDIIRVYAALGPKTRNLEVEETGAVVLHFANGCVGTFIFSDAAASPYNFEGATGENPNIPHTEQNIYQVFGTMGSLSFPENARWYYKGTQSWVENLTREESLEFQSVPPFTKQLSHFADVINGKEQPRCSAEEAFKTMLVLQAVKKSLDEAVPVDVLRK